MFVTSKPAILTGLSLLITAAVSGTVVMNDVDIVIEDEEDGDDTEHTFGVSDEIYHDVVEVHDDMIEFDNSEVQMTGDQEINLGVETHNFAGSGTHGEYNVQDPSDDKELIIDVEDEEYFIEKNGDIFTDGTDGEIEVTLDSDSIEIYTEEDLNSYTIEMDYGEDEDIIVDGDTDATPPYEFEYAMSDSDPSTGVAGLHGFEDYREESEGFEMDFDVGAGQALIATPDDDWEAVEDEREEFLANQFLDQPLASFTWPTPEEFTITAKLDYDDIELIEGEHGEFDADNWNEIIARHEEEGQILIEPD